MTAWSPEMLAELVADRTLLDMRLDAERESADRLAQLVQYLLDSMPEHEQAVLVAPAVPFFTVGDLARAELARHREWRRSDEERVQA